MNFSPLPVQRVGSWALQRVRMRRPWSAWALLQPPRTPPRGTPPPFQPVPVPIRTPPPSKGRRRRGWRVWQVPFPLPAALVVVTGSDVVASIVLYLIAHQLDCDRRLCGLATHGHPRLTMCLAIGSAVSLLGGAASTRCFRRGEWPLLVMSGVGAVVAAYAMAGLVAAAGLVLGALFLAGLVLFILLVAAELDPRPEPMGR